MHSRMSYYKIVFILTLGLLHCSSAGVAKRNAQGILGEFHYERKGLFSGQVNVPSIQAIAGNVLNSAREKIRQTIHELSKPISVEINVHLDENNWQNRQSNVQQDDNPSYPHYERPGSPLASTTDMYTTGDNNFPVILLKENEIRR